MKIFYEKYFQLFSCSRPVNCHRCVLSPLPQTPNYCDIFINTRISMNPQMKRERNKLEHGNNALVLTPSCRWVDISTWTPTPQSCLYLGSSPSDLDNSFFAESVLTSYNFLASQQIIFNLEHGHLKILDNFLSIIYYLFSAGES